ncbi:hypothetical protein RFI_15174 [Reticulomyxa filosa]|uniref:Uncharacterized protein n=1 Tax=Reticulomyxa filosa TaxID=46433 RepID=X6N8G1_RETFI|nr:hypothetical protein RFI_15174 [Reticulomyxa filosa]|eukprot:ETO22029.1 hypothetical protein RFI_15174 [Reticulomyxa filosa]
MASLSILSLRYAFLLFVTGLFAYLVLWAHFDTYSPDDRRPWIISALQQQVANKTWKEVNKDNEKLAEQAKSEVEEFMDTNMFCPIPVPQRKKYDRLFKEIIRLQYPAKCEFSPTQKYVKYIFRCSWGIMSHVRAMWLRGFMLALYLNRTFIWTDDSTWQWAPKDSKYCDPSLDNGQYKSYNCYFSPMTNCTQTLLYKDAQMRNYNFSVVE